MAAKLFSLIILAVFASLVYGDENCDCEDFDTKPLWEFFTKLSKEFGQKEITEEEKDMLSVSPALLSPLLDCNCLENSRKKRDIPEHTEDIDDVNHESEESNSLNQDHKEADSSSESNEASALSEMILNPSRWKRSIEHGTKFCPLNYARLGPFCIEESLLKDDDEFKQI